MNLGNFSNNPARGAGHLVMLLGFVRTDPYHDISRPLTVLVYRTANW